jgi:hypothetical protein
MQEYADKTKGGKKNSEKKNSSHCVAALAGPTAPIYRQKKKKDLQQRAKHTWHLYLYSSM